MNTEGMDLNDPRVLRQILRRVRHGDRIGGPSNYLLTSPAAALVKNCLDAAEFRGMSGEDAMTILAFNALAAYEKAYEQVLEFHSTYVAAPFVVVKDRPDA